LLAREACKLHEAAQSPALARLVEAFMPGTPPEIARDGMLHTWRSFNGSLRNVLFRQPIAIPLARIGPKVTFVHGRADHITALDRIQDLAKKIGAQVLTTDDDHLSYPRRSADRIVEAIR
jgi:hypothetical protein